MSNRKAVCKEYLTVSGILLALAAAVFFPAVFGGRFIYAGDYTGSDLLDLNLPLRFLAAEAVKGGSLPTWSKLIGNGFPLLAEGQAGVFYPLTLPLFCLFSVPTASNLSIILSLLIAGLGTYRLGRLYGLDKAAAVFSAVTFAFSPIVVFRLKHLNMLQVMVWLPWSLTCIKRTADCLQIEKRIDRVQICFLAAIWGLQILAGHPHMTCICGIADLIYAAVLWLLSLKKGDSQGLLQTLKGLSLALAAGAVLGAALGAAQLLPTFSLASQSTRSEKIPYEQLSQYPFKAEHLRLLLSPFLFENPADSAEDRLSRSDIGRQGVFWEAMPYLGLIALMALIPAFWHRDRRAAASLAVSALIMLLLAFGPAGRLYYLLWKFFPGFDRFRFPARFLVAFGSFAAVWAGLGLQTVSEALSKKYSRPVVSGVLILLIGAAALDLGININKYTAYPQNGVFAASQAAEALKGAARTAVPELQDEWYMEIKVPGWKREEAKIGAFMHCLPLDSAAFWHIPQHSSRIVWEGGMSFPEFWQMQTLQQKLLKLDKTSENRRVLRETAEFLYRLQNVSHLLSFNPWFGEDGRELKPVKEIKEPYLSKTLKIYKIGEPQPRVRLTADFRFIPPEKELKDFLIKYDGLLADGCCLLAEAAEYEDENAYASYRKTELGPNEYCRIIEEKDNYIKTECETAAARLLYMPENWSREWSAEADGKQIPLYRANYAFMACFVPAGKHCVILRHYPRLLTAGLLISLLGAACIISVLCFEAKGR
ncbi:YfhO family protein [bacterium]|nr:YfhO family protein [bacterium]